MHNDNKSACREKREWWELWQTGARSRKIQSLNSASGCLWGAGSPQSDILIFQRLETCIFVQNFLTVKYLPLIHTFKKHHAGQTKYICRPDSAQKPAILNLHFLFLSEPCTRNLGTEDPSIQINTTSENHGTVFNCIFFLTLDFPRLENLDTFHGPVYGFSPIMSCVS